MFCLLLRAGFHDAAAAATCRGTRCARVLLVVYVRGCATMNERQGVARLVGGVGLGLLCAACSTTSTIARIHEGPIEGDIVGGSSESIFVARDSGGECEIKRDDVSSIDYPGNVHRNAGVAVALYGALNIAVGLPECNERTEHKAAFCTGVFVPAAIGLGLIAWGIAVEHGQTSAVRDTSRPSSPPVGTAGKPRLTRPCLAPGEP